LQFRYRGSRRESAVAQLSTLGERTAGHTLSIAHTETTIHEMVLASNLG
jgi:hypothetical protein